MLIQTIRKAKKNNVPKEQSEEQIKQLRKEHDKLVKGMFEFVDAQGGWLDFSYRIFPGEDVQVIRLTHGEICELPMGIVKHLNNTKKKVRKFQKEIGENTRGLPSSYEVQSRVRFTPMNVL